MKFLFFKFYSLYYFMNYNMRIICVNTKRSRYTNYTKLQQENEERRKEEN